MKYACDKCGGFEVKVSESNSIRFNNGTGLAISYHGFPGLKDYYRTICPPCLYTIIDRWIWPNRPTLLGEYFEGKKDETST